MWRRFNTAGDRNVETLSASQGILIIQIRSLLHLATGFKIVCRPRYLLDLLTNDTPKHHFIMSSRTSEPERLKVAIVGGGIAGALAARVLREKHDVTIYERSSAPTEAGAAINVGPNGVKILESLGFDRERVGSLPVEETKSYNIQGRLLIHQRRNFVKEYGADWLFQHRADLRKELLRLATDDLKSIGIESRSVDIRWGTEISDVDVEEGVLSLSNGEKINADLIVGMY